MNDPGNESLETLLARYWDDALTAAQMADLQRRLRADPAARAQVRLFGAMAVTAAELNAPATPRPTTAPSRRRFAQYVGAAAVAGIGGLLVGRRLLPDVEPVAGVAGSFVRVGAFRGAAKLFAPEECPFTVGTAVPAGAVVATAGLDSTLRLDFPDGSSVTIAGNSSATVGADGRQVLLRHGAATADLKPAGTHRPPVLATDETTLTANGGATLAVGCGREATEVGCHAGRVTVADAAGGRVAEINGGEVITVRGDGDRKRQSLVSAPKVFAWDLTRPLPDTWAVGYRDTTNPPDGPVVRPRFWFDPYHSVPMCQIRSNQQWTKGFVQLRPESEVQVKYRAEISGPGQVVLVVRSANAKNPDVAVLEWNGTFDATPPGEWTRLAVPASEMLAVHNAPTYRSPWVAFLVVLNTYRVDLGLRVSEFRVSVPTGPPAER